MHTLQTIEVYAFLFTNLRLYQQFLQEQKRIVNQISCAMNKIKHL